MLKTPAVVMINKLIINSRPDKLMSLLLIMISLCFHYQSFGSEKIGETVPLVIGIRPHYGFIIVHSRDILPVKDSYPYGFGIEISRHQNSKKAFDRCLCFARLGVSTTFWDYNSREILGRGINSIFFVEPFYGINSKVSFSFRAGAGIAYANRPYNEISNPDNLSYSTRFSVALQVAATLNLWITEKIMMNVSASYNHISNGGMKEPNKGINYPTASIGIDYYLQKSKFGPFPPADRSGETSKRNRFTISAFATTRDLKVEDERKKYPAAGVNIRMSRRVSRLNAVNGGLEITGDWKNRELLKMNGESPEYLMAGIFAGNDFLLGRFIFGQQFGAYLYNPVGGRPDVFQRYHLEFMINNRLIAGLGLKAHGHVADFLDFRFGVLF
jgi:outer membrane protein W